MDADLRLSELLMRWEESKDNDDGLSLEQLCADCPELLEELRRLVAEMTALDVVVRPENTGIVSEEPDQGTNILAPGAPSRLPRARSRYRPLFFHARGSLGEVYVARDEELHRKVALKVIRERRVTNRESLRRFELEAEITGRLEHPGIVPVYGLGDYGDGRPCYAMRFVGRETLESRIEEFHEANWSGRDPSERSLTFRKLLGNFISVCNTVAYAHSRGILHRDLKPANILIGKYGETLVVDWGLAKPFERGEAARATGEETLDPSSSADNLRTHGLAGTPAYMSPEQADLGRVDSVGPPSDIANLGATLYALLTGQPPYRGENVGAVLEKVRRWDFPVPRQVKVEVPTTLEAICLKAMALDPRERQASARDLAEDLERWLADEPILAFRSSVSDYEALLRDHPEMSKYREGLSRSRTDLGNILHVLGRDSEAEANYRLAIVDYQTLVDQQPYMLHFREGLASSYMKLGRALTALGREQDAKDAYRLAFAEYELLVIAAPNALDYQLSLEHSIVLAGAGVDDRNTDYGAEPLAGAKAQAKAADPRGQVSVGSSHADLAQTDPDQANKGLNLLAGILAVQTGFASRDMFLTSIKSWLPDKTRPLAMILRDFGAFTEDVKDMLQALAQKHMDHFHGEIEKCLSTILENGPVRRDLDQVADGELLALLAPVSVDTLTHESDDSRRRSRLLTVERFRILRPHSMGGLSQVSVALDEQLNREVAIKQIQSRHADQTDQRTRFLFEATVAGSLEHPGIVPVYSLGETSDGLPFYAMRFIRGESFSMIIDQFHRVNWKERAAGSWSLELRSLLVHFISVCKTMAYAHSRGVIHRDLKPSNIMVGRYGETLVVDWGLAKLIGDNKSGPTREGSAGRNEIEHELITRDRDAWLGTQPGTVLGTPGYMSPEQARGEVEDLGPASDIYSLGATLFSLLTGHSPHEGTSIATVLHRVVRGDITPPRKLNRHVPRALEAVCLKAIALNPADRYVSPEALSNDLERWLGGQPVSVLHETWTARLFRWMRG
jgi:serine/threonine protein kinase